MLQRLLFGLITVTSLTLVGCAHSPQQLSPQPKLTTQLAPVGRGQPVVVRVVDGRPSPTLGTRGGKDTMYVTEATIGATFRSDVKNGGRTYSGRYGASLDQRFGMAPNQETNTKLVSDVLSDALTRVFKDPTIGRLLGE